MTPTTPAEIDALLALEEGLPAGPWAVAWTYDIIPLEHVGRSLGGAEDPAEDRKRYAHQIAYVREDRHGRHSRAAVCNAIAALPHLFTTLRALYARAVKAEAETDRLRGLIVQVGADVRDLVDLATKEQRAPDFERATVTFGSAAAQASAMKEGE